jgi:hypothetical protein
MPYMSIDIPTRKRRLGIIFGDLPLTVEPQLSEIPPDLYWHLALTKLLGGPAAVRGVNADLVLLKLPRLLPLEARKRLVLDYLSRIEAGRAGERRKLTPPLPALYKKNHACGRSTRPTHPTFSSFCEDKFHLARPTCDQLVRSTACAELLLNGTGALDSPTPLFLTLRSWRFAR